METEGIAKNKKIVMWLMENNAILTKTLIKRDGLMILIAYFCDTNESIPHMFFQCTGGAS